MFIFQWLLIFSLTIDCLAKKEDLIMQMITDVLQYDGIKFCYFLFCNCTKHEKVKMSIELQRNSIRTAFLSYSASLTKQFDQTENYLNAGYIIFNDNLVSTSSFDFIEQITRRKLLIVVKDAVPEKILDSKYFKDTTFVMDSGTKLVVPNNDQNLSFNIYNFNGSVNNLGFWKNGSLLIKSDTYYNEKINLTDIVIRGASTVLPEYRNTFSTHIRDTRRTRIDAISKFHYALFLLLQEIHNFSYQIELITLNEKIEFGNLTRMIMLLKDKKIDIGVCGAVQTYTDIDSIDFLMPYYPFRSSFFFQSMDKSATAYLKPFSNHTWYATSVVAVMIIILLRTGLKNCKANEDSWLISSLMVFQILCQQDVSDFPAHTGSRFIFISLLILSILLYNYYISIMVSLLLQAQPQDYQTVEELGRSRFEVALDEQDYTRNWFSQANFSNIRHLYKSKLFSNRKLNTYPSEEAIGKIRVGDFAYHTDTSTGYNMISEDFPQDYVCKLVELQVMPTSAAGLILQKRSKFFQLFQISLLRLRQSGLVHRLQMIWVAKKPKCFLQSNSELAPVGMDQALPAFLWLIAGMIFAFLFVVVELYWNRGKSSNQRRRRFIS